MTVERDDRGESRDLEVNPVFSREPVRVPRYALPDGEMHPDTAYQVVHDELMLDGNARQNLATFVSTWAEPQARRLMAECAEKNMIDKDEYPQTAELENRCVRMLARLWHAQDPRHAIGCSTTGSSEAAMLGGLALKRRWQHRRRAEGRPTDRPNLVMGINVQICWEKFADYFEVEPRYVPMEGDRYHLTPETAVELCDENTIGVVAVLGSTFDGGYEPVAGIAAALDGLRDRTGLDIPVHVDAASGGMIAPFLDPDLEWDFRLPRVASINTSGHKFGLVMPGVGWALWRDREALPDDLVFHVNYLGGDMPTFALNFSRPGAQVVAQYYNFLRLGFDGYRRVQRTCRDVATRLAAEIAGLGPFELLTDGGDLPVFAFRIRDGIDHFSVFDVSAALRERGWLLPAYTFPKNRTDLAVLRVVVRNGFSHDLADLLLEDLGRVLTRLDKQHEPHRDADDAGGFAHGAETKNPRRPGRH
ncbi:MULTISPECIES: glutamate decarboxylase [Streptomyces]|uniref:glutamate decarboxylase n=1 Tax=Streptomyces TaxID=1883 RepID=UPI00163C9C00|nr:MULTISPECIES: glutamate decarboxylase [Streptomyces]MBC2874280.1 glutamate decarboxylase [Streptomyces sp. TYQ1024]UBI40316.1 glutamate decarboxylase [Streptomyces mobaraensis]UKW32896.1 glutamate decarboxylase [Streptomyces sp. TYQ1024]